MNLFGCHAIYRTCLCCMHMHSILWVLKESLELSLRKSGSVCVLYAAALCEREREGGWAGNFPLLAAAAAGSFSTDRGISSARLSSAAGRGRQHLLSITSKPVGRGKGPGRMRRRGFYPCNHQRTSCVGVLRSIFLNGDACLHTAEIACCGCFIYIYIYHDDDINNNIYTLKNY